MNKTKIEWTDYTWNPIKGICPVGCWYCYARKMYNSKFYSKPPFDDPRIRIDGNLYNDGIIPYKLIPNLKKKKPSKIFVCSTFEIFHPRVLPLWRDYIFRIIESFPQHTFQILTKMPENIDRPMPDNVWLGVTITKKDELHRVIKLKKIKAKIKFISFEPVLGSLPIWMGALKGIDWIIIGKLTGFGRKYDVKNHIFKRRLAQVFLEAKRLNVPIFLKENLKDIWSEKLIQEFPE